MPRRPEFGSSLSPQDWGDHLVSPFDRCFPVSIGYDPKWASELVWTRWRREKYSCLPSNLDSLIKPVVLEERGYPFLVLWLLVFFFLLKLEGASFPSAINLCCWIRGRSRWPLACWDCEFEFCLGHGCSFCECCVCVSIIRCNNNPLRGGADKSLARQGRKQATATKLGIYSTYSPRSSIRVLARCSNFIQATQKKIRRLSVQPGLRGNNDRVGRKMATFQMLFFSPGNRW